MSVQGGGKSTWRTMWMKTKWKLRLSQKTPTLSKSMESQLLAWYNGFYATKNASDTTQRHQIFYSRCSVKSKVCNLLIDNESYKNIVSRALVDYLMLETESYPHSYAIGWIKKGRFIKVTDKYHIPISIIKFYQDFVACNVVDMDACHILLERPWQYVCSLGRAKELPCD